MKKGKLITSFENQKIDLQLIHKTQCGKGFVTAGNFNQCYNGYLLTASWVDFNIVGSCYNNSNSTNLD